MIRKKSKKVQKIAHKMLWDVKMIVKWMSSYNPATTHRFFLYNRLKLIVEIDYSFNESLKIYDYWY